MDESFDPTQETLNPYTAPPATGSSIIDLLTRALGTAGGYAQDIWNYQPFGAPTPPPTAPEQTNSYMRPIENRAEGAPSAPVRWPEFERDPRRTDDPYSTTNMLLDVAPQLAEHGTPLGLALTRGVTQPGQEPMSAREQFGHIASAVTSATPFEPAAVGPAGMLRTIVSGAEPAAGSLAADIASLTGRQRGPKVPPLGSAGGFPEEEKLLQVLYDYGTKLGGNKWYHGFRDAVYAKVGNVESEAQKYARVAASLSPLRPAGALTKEGMKLHEAGELAGEIPDFAVHMGSNLMMAERVWDAYKRGGVEEVDRVLGPLMEEVVRGGKTIRIPTERGLAVGEEGIGVMESVRKNVLKALNGEQIGGREAQKIQNFAEALLGDKNAIVLDTWMKRIFYPVPYVYNRKLKKYEETIEPTAFSAAQYRATEDIIKNFATKMGVSNADVQAAMWVAQKYIDEGHEVAASGSMPFVKSFDYVRRYLDQDLKNFDPSVTKTMGIAALLLGGGFTVESLMGGGEAEAALPSTSEASGARPYTGQPMLSQ